MNCNHESLITITAKSTGKSKTFCSDCLYESETKPFVMPDGGLLPYSIAAAEQLMAAALTDWEKEFLPSLAKMRNGPTDKQLAIWTRTVRKHFPNGLPQSAAPRELPSGVMDDLPF